MVSNEKLRARSYARAIYALAQTSSDEDLVRWKASYAPDLKTAVEALRAARALLLLVGEALASDVDARRYARIEAAVAALEGRREEHSMADAPAGTGGTDEQGSAPSVGAGDLADAKPARLSAAQLTETAAACLPDPPDLAPAVERVSPWARATAAAPASLEPNIALARTEDGTVPNPTPALPFAGPPVAPAPLRSEPAAVEPLPAMGFTADITPPVGSLRGASYRSGESTEKLPENDLELYVAFRQAHEGAVLGSDAQKRLEQLDALWNERFRSNLPLFRSFQRLMASLRRAQ